MTAARANMWLLGSHPMTALDPQKKHRADPNPFLSHDQSPSSISPNPPDKRVIYLVDEEYLVTALVPSETACLASSPGRISRTLEKKVRYGKRSGKMESTHDVWISREEMVDFLL